MSAHQEYPHMLYKGGEIGEDYVIVADAGEEAHAKTEGYARAGKPKAEKPVKAKAA